MVTFVLIICIMCTSSAPGSKITKAVQTLRRTLRVHARLQQSMYTRSTAMCQRADVAVFFFLRMPKVKVLPQLLFISISQEGRHTRAQTHEHDTPACLHPPRAYSSPSPAPPPLHPLTSIEKINAIHYHHRREEIQGQKGAKRLASPLLTHSSRVVTSGTGGRVPCAPLTETGRGWGGVGEWKGA